LTNLISDVEKRMLKTIEHSVIKSEELFSQKFLRTVLHRGEPMADVLDSKIGMSEVMNVAVHKTDNTVTQDIQENLKILHSQLQHSIILLGESFSLNC